MVTSYYISNLKQNLREMKKLLAFSFGPVILDVGPVIVGVGQVTFSQAFGEKYFFSFKIHVLNVEI